jgi:hypothetical protein
MSNTNKVVLMERKMRSLLTIVVFNFLFIACKNDCDNYKPDDIYYSINQGYLNMVPYKGYDTLIFLRNNTDTIRFYGNGKIKFETTENGDLGGCGPTEINHNENFNYKFNSFGPYNSIVISLNYPEYFYCYFRNRTFKIPMSSLLPPFDLEKMEVNGIVYSDINFIPRQPIDTLYYDNENGLIRFGFQNSEQWTLLKY